MKFQTGILQTLLAAALAVTPAQAAGITLTVNPMQPSAGVGETTQVDFTISGLGAMSAPSLSAFDFDLKFDPALVSVSHTLFGSSSAPFDQLNISGAGSIAQANQPSPGDLHLIEVSLDSPSVLDSRQQGAFTLAEVSLRGLQPGTTALSFSVNTLGDSQGNPLSASSVIGASLAVTPGTATPEPGSFALLCFGGSLLLSLIWRRETCIGILE